MDSMGENPGASRAEVVGDEWKPDGEELGSDGELGCVAVRNAGVLAGDGVGRSGCGHG